MFIPARIPDLVLIKKKEKEKEKTYQLVNFAVPAEGKWKKAKIDKYLDLARELKKAVEHEGDDDTNCKCYI